jgi:hypothetical protein
MNALRLSPLQHFASMAGAIVIVASLFAGAAATAQPLSGFYSATLNAAPAEPRTVAGGVVWACEGTSCTAPRGTSRPAVICGRLVRELGPVASFTANGEAFDAAALARCNGTAS